MRLFVVAAFVLSVGSASGQNGRSPNSDARDTEIFHAICGSCHSISLVEGLRTESEWREEVNQMVKIGARGTDEQFQGVMRFLTRTLTKVNVNTAEARQIGLVLNVTDGVAEALVKHRTANGAFKTIEDLKRVSGLDAAKLEARKDRILF